MNWLYGTWAVFEKDLRLELRSRYAVSMLLLFVLSSLLLVAFGLGPVTVSPRVQSALLWVVILFSAAVGLGRAFISEEERGTVLLLRLNTRGSMVYAGKLLFNFLLVLGVNLVALGAFILLLRVAVQAPGLLLATLVLGALGLAGATTLLAALIARAANRGPLLPVLLFPLLVPLLLSVVSATRAALPGGNGWREAGDELTTLFGFAGVVITVSVLLFDHVWNE
ncbi:heme exporter protein CcmB [Rhodocaloribacter litoris]|uniref:heme exporter protein CcmB n=1 Tax=Rhodocaloribacter litoris TaxID=2558931 RepID=UPI00142470F9|nr:heme exporter protein CcmB [Rhodocaloribacter litoris]QXD14151.1 heme exporter protein CcmB [Rhodocaloribacter litoris]